MYSISNLTVNVTPSSLLTTTIHTTEALHQKHHDPVWFFWLQIILLSILMVLVVIGNLMVLYCLLNIKEMQTVTGLFLTNLAVTDLGVGFISLPLSLAASVEHFLLHYKWFCALQGIVLVLFVLASLLTLGVISLQKYINVSYTTFNRFRKIHAKYAITLIWLMAAIFAFAPLLGWSTFSFSRGGHQCAPYEDSMSGYSYMLALFLIGLIIPTGTMVFCYYKLYLMTRWHNRRMKASEAGTTVRTTRRSMSSVETHMIHTLMIMMIAFFICWLPTIIMFLLKTASFRIPHIFEMTVLLCASGNSAVNPILYAMRQQDFQRGFRKILKSVCGSSQVEDNNQVRRIELAIVNNGRFKKEDSDDST